MFCGASQRVDVPFARRERAFPEIAVTGGAAQAPLTPGAAAPSLMVLKKPPAPGAFWLLWLVWIQFPERTPEEIRISSRKPSM